MFCRGRCSTLTRIAFFIRESMVALSAESCGRGKHVEPMCTLTASEGRAGKRLAAELEALPGGLSTVIRRTLRLGVNQWNQRSPYGTEVLFERGTRAYSFNAPDAVRSGGVVWG